MDKLIKTLLITLLMIILMIPIFNYSANATNKLTLNKNNKDLINEAYLTDTKAQELISLYNSNKITENEKIKRFNDLKDSYNLDTIRNEEDKKQAIYQLGYSLDIYSDNELASVEQEVKNKNLNYYGKTKKSIIIKEIGIVAMILFIVFALISLASTPYKVRAVKKLEEEKIKSINKA